MKKKTKIYEILALIEKHGPISPNRLTEITGDFRQSIDKYVREAHAAEWIHVAAFGPSPLGGNRVVKLYAAGKGIDAHRETKKARAAPKQKEAVSRRCKAYSPAEKRILRSIKFSGKTVKSQMHRLPGRTLHGAQRAISSLRGQKKRGCTSWIWTAILSTLDKTPDLTSVELGEAIGCTSRQVIKLLTDNHADSNRSVHISSWAMRHGAPARRWSLGAKKDAPRPPRKENEHELARRRARHHIRRAKARPFAMTVSLLQEAA